MSWHIYVYDCDERACRPLIPTHSPSFVMSVFPYPFRFIPSISPSSNRPFEPPKFGFRRAFRKMPHVSLQHACTVARPCNNQILGPAGNNAAAGMQLCTLSRWSGREKPAWSLISGAGTNRSWSTSPKAPHPPLFSLPPRTDGLEIH